METLIDVNNAFRQYKPHALYWHTVNEKYYMVRMVLDHSTVFDRFDESGNKVDEVLIRHDAESNKLTFITEAPKELLNLKKMETNVQSMKMDLQRIDKTIIALQGRKEDFETMLLDMEKALEENKSNYETSCNT